MKELQHLPVQGTGRIGAYEIHITVDLGVHAVEFFRETCASLNVKPVLIAMQLRGDSSYTHLMTSSHVSGMDHHAVAEALRITKGLEDAGFQVIRQKIEASQWHLKAPRNYGDVMPKGCYFEIHLPLKMKPERIPRLVEVAMLGARVSRNIFKIHDDGDVTVMVTLRRDNLPCKSFKKEVDSLVALLILLGFHVDIAEPKIEFALFDTNVHLDHDWLS